MTDPELIDPDDWEDVEMETVDADAAQALLPAVIEATAGEMRCQRCGEDHVLTFRQLVPPIDDYGWWAPCPTTGEPILLRAVPSPVPCKTGNGSPADL